MQYIVLQEEHGKTLLDFLQSKQEGLSGKKLKQAIDHGACMIGGKVELFSSRKVIVGEVVSLLLFSLEESKEFLSILFENEHFLAVNKPPFVVCEEGKIQSLLPRENREAHLLHRLDKDTSGVLLFAKTKEGLERGKALFAQRQIDKTYLACVEGEVKTSAGMISNQLGVKRVYAGQTLYQSVEKGRSAITHFRVWKKGRGVSLLICRLVTGRTHQIRVHMSEMGHPLVGDYLYGKRSSMAKRQLLHAERVSFVDPWTQQKVLCKAPIPADFAQSLDSLGINIKKRSQ